MKIELNNIIIESEEYLKLIKDSNCLRDNANRLFEEAKGNIRKM